MGLVLLSEVGLLWADPATVYLHKVKVFMNNGSQITGYVFWGQEDSQRGPFTTNKFLEHWAKHLNNATKFDLFKSAFNINDKGYLAGIAHLKGDEIQIDALEVKKIISTPDKFEGKGIVCGFPPLTKAEIDQMQSRLYYTDTMASGVADVLAFSYDPKVGKALLHKILLDFQKSSDFGAKAEKFKRKVLAKKVVLVYSGCD